MTERSEVARQVAVAHGSTPSEAARFSSWYAHMWPDDNVALAFNAWVAAPAGGPAGSPAGEGVPPATGSP